MPAASNAWAIARIVACSNELTRESTGAKDGLPEASEGERKRGARVRLRASHLGRTRRSFPPAPRFRSGGTNHGFKSGFWARLLRELSFSSATSRSSARWWKGRRRRQGRTAPPGNLATD